MKVQAIYASTNPSCTCLISATGQRLSLEYMTSWWDKFFDYMQDSHRRICGP